MADLKRKTRLEAAIPTASMADIAFLLLLFFMVSTVFVKEKKQDVTLPKASEDVIDKIDRKNSATVYVRRDGTITIDDMIIKLEEVEFVMGNKVSQNMNLLTAFRTDKSAEYGIMNDVMSKLQSADAVRVYFEVKKKGV